MEISEVYAEVSPVGSVSLSVHFDAPFAVERQSHQLLPSLAKLFGRAVDDGVGQILDYLNKNNMAENTMVIYTSDQGFFLG